MIKPTMTNILFVLTFNFMINPIRTLRQMINQAVVMTTSNVSLPIFWAFVKINEKSAEKKFCTKN